MMQQPQWVPQYHTEVNKGSIRMQTLQGHLNDMGRQGWRLQFIFEQAGNTIIIFERMVQA
jgi:hypothetical protein